MDSDGGDGPFEISETGDSFLREVLCVDEPPRLPGPGETFGGQDGRRYSVLAWMGSGAMGQVFRVWDEALRREVALKFLLSRVGCIAEALREARAIARLDHENIVRVFDVVEWSDTRGAPGVPVLVMECLEGESLSALLKRERPTTCHALEILDAVAAGLAHAHERHLVHRDLKPSNVFLTRQGTVKLLDFGLSHFGDAGVPHLPTAGTPAYMAPEQWRGGPQDARTDVWAAGVMLYELLTGSLPFAGATLTELRERVTSEDAMPPVRARQPEVPREVESLLATALAKDPARRFPSALELREELRELRARLRSGGEASAPVDSHRGQMTLLACQLTGLTGEDAPLDAEDVGELELAFQRACSEIIERHGGSSTLSMGGELLACFGCSQVREDDAERAVRAGLELTRALRETLQRRLPHLPLADLSVRVGIYTDQVAVGAQALEARSGGLVIQGEAPKVVSWLARRAGPGELVLGHTTWLLVRGAFETEDLGRHVLEGLSGSTSLRALRVLRERGSRLRFDRTLAAGGLTPLVGREHELGELLARWERARDGQGAFVLIRGEAGIGKSRLIRELFERVPPEAAPRLHLQCLSSFSATLCLHLVVELLQHLLRASPEAPLQGRVEEWVGRLEALGLSELHVHLLGVLLGLPLPDGSPASRLTFERRKEETQEALVHVLHAIARRRPMLLVVEDVQWADSTRLENLERLLRGIERERILVVLSARPEFQPSWARREGVHWLELDRLPVGLAEALVREAAHGTPLPEGTVQDLVRKTDGIPLFIEELTRMVVERAAAGQEGLPGSIPVTLHELLLARLDMLPSRQKSLAQVCAVLGREFSHALLAAVAEREDVTLRRELAGLVEAGLLQEARVGGGPGYGFRHVLLQEAALQSLSRSTRRQHHRHVAQMLVERFPEVVEARPEVLAHHYTEAGAHEAAVPCWTRAGQLALQRSANPEAQGHFGRALALLRGLPDAPHRSQEELWIQLGLSGAMIAVQGFDSPEVERNEERMFALLMGMGEELPGLGPCYQGCFLYFNARLRFHEGHALAVRVIEKGERLRDPELLCLGHGMRAILLLIGGRPREALAHIERAVEYSSGFDLEQLRQLAVWHPMEPRTLALVYAGVVHSVLGHPEAARRYDREAVELTRRIGAPYTTAYAFTFVAISCLLRGEVREAQVWADQANALSSERSFLAWQMWSRAIQGRVRFEQGNTREGLTLVQEAVARWRVLGLRTGLPGNLMVLAMMQLRLGQVEEGLAVVQEALEEVERWGERVSLSEVHRVRGELLRARGDAREAKSCFLRALAVAREQGMGLFELRATVSLCRLLWDQGRRKVARRLLARAYARFEAGGASVNLQEARALLEELGPGDAPSPPTRGLH